MFVKVELVETSIILAVEYITYFFNLAEEQTKYLMLQMLLKDRLVVIAL